MILDLQKFITQGRPEWEALEHMLKQLDDHPDRRMALAELQEFHRLYLRVSADLTEIATFASEREIRTYLESLVARAYGEIHETRQKAHRFRPFHWFFQLLPQTFRRHIRAFWLALGITVLGMFLGAGALCLDPSSKEILMPFSHLQGDPGERVAKEEFGKNLELEEQKAAFASFLMTHNTRVAILTFALGMLYGSGTLAMLFYNGVMLGAVAFDYIQAGKTLFLLGWLLPHGVIEIPSILIAGQAGLILGSALIGWGSRQSLSSRLRIVGADVVTLIAGTAVLLIWAGVVESFLSQYHEPVVPYVLKISFGLIELTLLVLFLGRSGFSKLGAEFKHG